MVVGIYLTPSLQLLPRAVFLGFLLGAHPSSLNQFPAASGMGLLISL